MWRNETKNLPKFKEISRCPRQAFTATRIKVHNFLGVCVWRRTRSIKCKSEWKLFTWKKCPQKILGKIPILSPVKTCARKFSVKMGKAQRRILTTWGNQTRREPRKKSYKEEIYFFIDFFTLPNGGNKKVVGPFSLFASETMDGN